MRISPSRKRRSIGRNTIVAALAIAALAPAGAQAAAPPPASEDLGASALFTAGGLTVAAPDAAVSFGSTPLDGRASYDLKGDIGDWQITDATGDLKGWTSSVRATNPRALDTGAESADAVMSMHVPTATGNGDGPTMAPGDVDGFVSLAGEGTEVANATIEQGVGKWQMAQSGGDDIRLIMPFDTRPTQYDSTVTFTVAQGL
jgi:hypothetical protein